MPTTSDTVLSIVRNEMSLLRRDALQRMFDPRRDVDKECGYPTSITPQEYKALWDREGLAKRVVSLLPMECWKIDPWVYEQEDAENPTAFEQDWEDLCQRLNILAQLERADILSGIGRYGVILLGIGDGQDLRTPVKGIDETGKALLSNTNKLLYLRVFSEDVCMVNAREANPANPRFGQPTLYTLTLQDVGMSGGEQTLTVHWSRVIHVADERETSEVFGVPRLQPVFNRILDIKKVLGGSGEMFWKGALPGLSFEVSPGIENVTLDTTSVREEVEKYMNGLQRYIALEGLSAKSLTPQIGDPRYHVASILENICLSLGVPKRVFLGSEEAKLAGAQDADAWNSRLKRRQNVYISPLILRPFVDRLVNLGVLMPPAEADFETGDLGYEVWWPDLNTVTETEKATVAGLRTTALASYVSGGVEAIIPPKEYLTIIQGMDEKEVKQIMDAADANQAAMDEAALHDAKIQGQAETTKAAHAPAPDPVVMPGAPGQ